MTTRKVPALILGSNIDDLTWKCREGTHFYCRTNKLGYIETVQGVVSPAGDGVYIACIHNKFDSYREFDSLEAAYNHVAAIVALEGEQREVA